MLNRISLVLGMLLLSVCFIHASGGNGGGGGGGGNATYRITGTVTAIDTVASTITIGASYYNSGVVKVTSATKVVRNLVNTTATSIQLGDYAEADVYFSREAKKIQVTGP